jgi:hypothetical protein
MLGDLVADRAGYGCDLIAFALEQGNRSCSDVTSGSEEEKSVLDHSFVRWNEILKVLDEGFSKFGILQGENEVCYNYIIDEDRFNVASSEI